MDNKIHNNCIVLGDNLKTKHDYHLLVNRNGIQIDHKMSESEYQLIYNLITAMSPVNTELLTKYSKHFNNCKFLYFKGFDKHEEFIEWYSKEFPKEYGYLKNFIKL